MEAHNEAVQAISAQVKRFHATQQPYRIYHGSTNSTRQSQRRAHAVVDLSGLDKILLVDTAARTALVQPNVAMDALVAATRAHGLVPPVVMEFPGITAGGGFAGTSGESSSFRHGFFDATVRWVEMVLADGTIVRASRTQNPDLFAGAAGALGTLGVTTLLELTLVPATRYVQLTHYPVSNVADALVRMNACAQDPDIDYLDGMMLSAEAGIVFAGHRTDVKPRGSSLQRFTRPADPWFYLHALDMRRRYPNRASSEYIPLEDYLFRWDRGSFWMGPLAFEYFYAPFNRFTRWLLDSVLRARPLYRALHASGDARRIFIQDVAVPAGTTSSLVDFLNDTLAIYPLWLCPLRKPDSSMNLWHPQLSPTHGARAPNVTLAAAEESFELMNVGVWGEPRATLPGASPSDEFVHANRLLEAEVSRLGGRKWLYARTYYRKDEFWTIYDHETYSDLRDRYHAQTLPTVWDKVQPADGRHDVVQTGLVARLRRRLARTWPLPGLYGVFRACWGGDYLLGRTWLERVLSRQLANNARS